MNKPIDPRKNGLKEPKALFTEYRRLSIGKDDETRHRELFGDNNKVSLADITDAWDREMRRMNSICEHGTIDGPYVEVFCDRQVIMYTIEKFNQNYAQERAEYDAKIAEFVQERKAYDLHVRSNENRTTQSEINRIEAHLAKLRSKLTDNCQ